MKEFYFTFGQTYRHEPHPQGGHPDGWFTIEASSSEMARQKMFEVCGPRWAMQYDEPPGDRFPLGELKRFKTFASELDESARRIANYHNTQGAGVPDITEQP